MAQAAPIFADEKRLYYRESDLMTLFRLASQQTGRPRLSIFLDYWRVRNSVGRLTIQDYFNYRLYEGRYSKAERESFISGQLHWSITDCCSDTTWRSTTEDKWLSYEILNRNAVRTPVTLAVVERGLREYGGHRKISNAAELAAFLAAVKSFPIFAKPNRAMASFGAFVVTGFDGATAELGDLGSFSCQEVMDKVIGDKPYLFQELIENHPDIKKLTRFTPTVRTMNLVDRDRVMTPVTLLKLPVGDNIADNYWRKGNLLCKLDTESGEIHRVIRGKGPEMEELEEHPVTGERLIGFKWPHWQELRAVNEKCARLFAPVRYQSLDIAVAPEGPLVVEINSGGSFELPQLASATGFLSDDVSRFFQSCGWQPSK